MTMNLINIANILQDERQLTALIGLDLSAFEKLLDAFIVCLKESPLEKHRSMPKNKHQRKPRGGHKPALGSPENQLFFIL